MFLTSAELALISPAGALVGVVLGIVSTRHLERSRERQAVREAHEQVITEVQTAVVDLLSGVQTVKATYQHETSWRHYIRVAALVTASIGLIMKSEETLSWKLLDLQRISPAFERALAEERALNDRQRTIALDFATTVGPRVTRFYESAGKLTLGTDGKVADAARTLIRAIGALLDAIGGKERDYMAARQRAYEALGSFREVVGQEHRQLAAGSWWSRTRRASASQP